MILLANTQISLRAREIINCVLLGLILRYIRTFDVTSEVNFVLLVYAGRSRGKSKVLCDYFWFVKSKPSVLLETKSFASIDDLIIFGHYATFRRLKKTFSKNFRVLFFWEVFEWEELFYQFSG